LIITIISGKGSVALPVFSYQKYDFYKGMKELCKN